MLNQVTNEFLMFATNKGIETIGIDDIIRVEAISNYSKLYLSTGKTLVVSRTLRWVEEKLPPRLFVRTHRAHLVNTNFVLQYINGTGGMVKLLNGEMIHVSKRKKAWFLCCWHVAA